MTCTAKELQFYIYLVFLVSILILTNAYYIYYKYIYIMQ